jgi:hypothetical protein
MKGDVNVARVRCLRSRCNSPHIKANDDAKEKRDRRKSMAIEFSKRDLVSTPNATPKKASRLGAYVQILLAWVLTCPQAICR